MPRQRAVATVVLALVVSGGWHLLAACPVGPDNACVIDLHGKERPGVSANCSAEPWKDYLKLEQPNGSSDADGNHWWEAVVELSLDAARGCRCASFTVHYGDDPSGWTVNVGDSPTNNGAGGDEGDTPWDAEIEVTAPPGGEGVFRVHSADLRGGGDVLLDQVLPLGSTTLKLQVCDQEFEAELISADPEAVPLRWKMQTSNSQSLFALAGQVHPLEVPGRVADQRLYAAFNRVIHHRSGPADKKRLGTGVRRVEIALTP